MSVILITIICKNITNCTQERVRNAKKMPISTKNQPSCTICYVSKCSHKIISPLSPRLLRILYLRDFLSSLADGADNAD